jgi:hypothetical protein
VAVAAAHEHETSPAPKQPAPAVPTAAAPVAGQASLTPAAVLQLQRSAGNAALARMLSSPPSRQLQRCGSSCGCTKCSAEDLHDQRLARVLARQKPPPSVRKGGRCEPPRTISGVVFVPWLDKEVEVANKAVQGSKKALANQAITLDLEVKPYLELGNLSISDENDNRTVSSYDQVCLIMEELESRRSKPGVVVLVVPISGEICAGHGQACYVPNLKDRCPALKYTRRLIIVGRFMSEDDLGEVLAHELGHHAGRKLSADSTEYGHEEYDKGNYMNYGKNRDHYRSELLDRMCGISFVF